MRDLQERTLEFALDVIRMVNGLSDSRAAARTITTQLVQSATSAAANYRAARRAKSPRDFLYKLRVVEEEVDEAEGWLLMLTRSGLADSPEVRRLLAEAGELTAIFAASVLTQERKLR